MNYQPGILRQVIVILLFLCSLLISGPVSAASLPLELTDEEQQWLDEHRTIRVSGPQAFPPFQFFNEKNEYVGIATDYLDFIAGQLGITVEYQPKMAWSTILEKLRNKEIDLLSCAAYTKERSAFMQFTDPHINFPLIIVSRKDAPEISGMQDIDGMRIALVKAISTEALLKENNIVFTPRYIGSPREALKTVSLNDADIAIENLATASYIIEQEGLANLKVAASTGAADYALSIAIRKDWQIFHSIMNKALAAISEEQHREIRERWVSIQYDPGIRVVSILKWSALSLLVILAAVAVIVLWNRRLIRKIEERRRIELKLRESERKLSTLIDNLPGIAYRCRNEKDWPMEFISDGCHDITGYMPSEISRGAPLNYGDIIHPDDRKAVWQTVQEEIKKKANFEIEYRLITKSGGVKWVWERGRVVSDLQTDSLYLEGFIADITNQKILTDQLQHAQKMEALGTLAGGIAHDFNNILSSVLGFTELALNDAKKGSEQEDSLNEVREAGLRAKELVQQILAFARKSEEKQEPVHVALVIAEVMKLIRSSLPTTIEIEHHLETDCLVMGNTTRLHQIMMNLCSNAAQAMEEKGGVLALSVRAFDYPNNDQNDKRSLKPGKYVEITVSDTGQGIPANLLDKVFEPYFTTKTLGKGTGLGLAMVHGIVETYGGKIFVESHEGVGTTFSIYFPRAEDALSRELRERGRNLPQGTERILFVDDEPSVMKMVTSQLELLGYNVTSMTSSVEALERFTATPDDFDLVVSDITMPQLTGDQLTRQVLQIRPDMPVILCTGYSKKVTEDDADDIGVRAYLYKPITRKELANTIREVLDSV